VDELLDLGDVALCGPIVTELRRGLRPTERSRVLPLLEGCTLLEQPEDLWTTAGDLGAALARRGIVVKTLDVLIATYAIGHGVAVLTRDTDFKAIANAKVGLILA
jgi:predicted nucleic acid-binding protein